MAAPRLPNWQSQLLGLVKAPVTPENLRFVNAEAQAEGGSASNNPWNTTQDAPGATDYNSVGVRNYLSPEQGLRATADTLLNGRYGNVVDALRSGNSAVSTAQALAASPWGTGSLVLKVLGAGPVAAAGGSAPSATPVRVPMPAPPPAYKPVDFTQAILGSIGKSPLAIMRAITQKAISTPVAQSISPVRTATTPNGTAFEIQGKVTGKSLAAVALAEHFVGTPYKYGGESASGFDCSGLLQYVWGKQGVSIPRTTYEQFQTGTPVAKSQLQPGDAVYFTGSDPKNGLPGHVGMYVGGGKFIEAPHTGADVRVSTLAGRRDYVGARTFDTAA